MQIYKVGGAVRDRLLGRPVTDIDWVVVGASSDEMLARGYRPVGADFPVFLHPQSGEEYALARTERKSGRGYGGFTFLNSLQSVFPPRPRIPSSPSSRRAPVWPGNVCRAWTAPGNRSFLGYRAEAPVRYFVRADG